MKISRYQLGRIKYGIAWFLGFTGFIAICLMVTMLIARATAKHTSLKIPPAPSFSQALHLPAPSKK